MEQALAAARADAARAEQRSGVRIAVAAGMTDAVGVASLFTEIWRTAPTDPPIAAELLRVLSVTGGYLGTAWLDGRLVGGSIAFCTRYGLHSHISGVHPTAQDRSVGYALKLHQRAWGLERGVREVSWTFDPLVRRNAWFNLVKLGGVAVEYLPEFYGQMAGVNAGDLSDRMLVHWDLAAPRTQGEQDEAALLAAGAVRALAAGADGSPERQPLAAGRAALVQLPGDIVQMRTERPDLARAWRMALRETLQPAFEQGRPVLGMTRSGSYVLAPGSSE